MDVVNFVRKCEVAEKIKKRHARHLWKRGPGGPATIGYNFGILFIDKIIQTEEHSQL